ncbi:hypothetical protein [Burkholderia sp. YIM B11467]
MPFAVSCVDAKLGQTVAATRGEDLYDWVAGVARQNNLGGLWDNYAVRGLAGDGTVADISRIAAAMHAPRIAQRASTPIVSRPAAVTMSR